MLYVFWIVMAYVLGSFPFGVLVARMVCGVDPRTSGSRNTGATNVARLCGTRVGVAVLALDLLKGFAPVAMAVSFSCNWFFLSLTILAALVGHMHSCFLGLKGGKGVATFIGCFLAVAPVQTVIGVAFTIALIALSGYVSLGSLALGASMPLLLLLSGRFGLVLVALAAGALLFWKHRENIERLARGQENPWRKSKAAK